MRHQQGLVVLGVGLVCVVSACTRPALFVPAFSSNSIPERRFRGHPHLRAAVWPAENAPKGRQVGENIGRQLALVLSRKGMFESAAFLRPNASYEACDVLVKPSVAHARSSWLGGITGETFRCEFKLDAEILLLASAKQERLLFEGKPKTAEEGTDFWKHRKTHKAGIDHNAVIGRTVSQAFDGLLVFLEEQESLQDLDRVVADRKPSGAEPHVVDVKPDRGRPPAPPSRRANYWAVSIGVSKYKDQEFSPLSYAAKDATDFVDLLRDQARMDQSQLLLLTDAKATKANTEDALEGFLSKARRDDVILLYWSGHGFPDPSKPTNVYFACYDTKARKPHTGYRIDKVRESLEEKGARNVVVFADTCHAGKIITRSSDKGLGDVAVGPYIRELARTQRVPKGMAFLTASATDRKAVEHSSWSNGAFTHVLLEALRGGADGYQGVGPKDEIITFGEVRAFVQTRMPEETYKVLGKALHPETATTTGDVAINRLPLVFNRR